MISNLTKLDTVFILPTLTSRTVYSEDIIANFDVILGSKYSVSLFCSIVIGPVGRILA